MKTPTWECIVWNGSRWMRFPDITFLSAEAAFASAARISISAVYVRTTADLDANGLPVAPPPQNFTRRFPLDTVKRKE